jgi:molybdate transport repressor ModE-like protein
MADDVVGDVAGPAAITEVAVRYGEDSDRSELDGAMAGLVDRWGATDGYPRSEQPANSALQADVKGFGELSFMFPLLFLTAAGLGTWVMLTRLVMSQMSVIGTLMASGMRRRTIFGHYLSYGVVAGLSGAVPGVIAGVLMAWGIAGLYTDAISVPITVLRIDATTPLVGIAFGVIAGLAAAAFPAWRAVRRSPAEAMRGAHPSGTATATIVERLIPPLRRLPASLAMVMRGISRNARRTATTMLGVVLSLVLILVSWGMIDTVEALMVRQFEEIEQSDARVVLDRPPTEEVLRALSSVSGVAAVEPTAQAQVAVQANGDRYGTTLEAYLPGTSMHRFLGGDGELALPDDGVLLGEDMAGLLGISVNDEVTLLIPAPDVTLPQRVAGFVDEPLGTYAYGSLTGLVRSIEAESAAGAGEEPLTVVFGAAVRFADDADPDVMRARLQDVDGVVAVAGTRAFEETLRSFMGLFYAFVGVMLVFGGLLAFGIIFNTMSVNLAERTVEVATLKASGMTDRRLAGLVSLENVIVTLLGDRSRPGDRVLHRFPVHGRLRQRPVLLRAADAAPHDGALGRGDPRGDASLPMARAAGHRAPRRRLGGAGTGGVIPSCGAGVGAGDAPRVERGAQRRQPQIRVRYPSRARRRAFGMEPRFNIWFEIDGDVAASRWRMRLLSAIDEQGSITGGARAMGIPYRVAWQKVHEMEQRLGERLLETHTGGAGGGGAGLTEAGRDHVERMRDFCDRVEVAIREIFLDTFGVSGRT